MKKDITFVRIYSKSLVRMWEILEADSKTFTEKELEEYKKTHLPPLYDKKRHKLTCIGKIRYFFMMLQ